MSRVILLIGLGLGKQKGPETLGLFAFKGIVVRIVSNANSFFDHSHKKLNRCSGIFFVLLVLAFEFMQLLIQKINTHKEI